MFSLFGRFRVEKTNIWPFSSIHRPCQRESTGSFTAFYEFPLNVEPLSARLSQEICPEKMNHYEKALLSLLSETVTCLNFRQTRKRLFPTGYLKNFDFLVLSSGGRFLLDVKGKTFPSGRHYILETSLWRQELGVPDLPELESYIRWVELFGDNFTFLISYPYWIKRGAEDLSRFEQRLLRSSPEERIEIFCFQERLYGLLAVRLEDFLGCYNIGARHPRLRASGEKLLKPLGYFIPEVESHPAVYSLRKARLNAKKNRPPERVTSLQKEREAYL